MTTVEGMSVTVPSDAINIFLRLTSRNYSLTAVAGNNYSIQNTGASPTCPIYYQGQSTSVLTVQSSSAGDISGNGEYGEGGQQQWVQGTWKLILSYDINVPPSIPHDCINGACTPKTTYNTPGLYVSLEECEVACGTGCSGICVSNSDWAKIEGLAGQVKNKVCS